MLGKNLLWVAKQHGHSVQTMLDVYAAWIEGSKESDLEAIRQAMESSPRARARMASGGGVAGFRAGVTGLASSASPRATSSPSAVSRVSAGRKPSGREPRPVPSAPIWH